MKYSILLCVLMAAGPLASAAPVTLLSCNTQFGPDQEVTVQQDGARLTLIELTNFGGTARRELSNEEWNSKKLNLREENGFKTTLTLEAKGEAWLHVTDGAGYNEYGAADCE